MTWHRLEEYICKDITKDLFLEFIQNFEKWEKGNPVENKDKTLLANEQVKWKSP